MRLRVYIDGACSGNPGPGGWACVICRGETIDKCAGHVEHTTNNQMELYAAVQALSTVLKDVERKYKGFDEIEITSDSAYVVSAVQRGWLEMWQASGWKTASDDDVKNKTLWLDLLASLRHAEGLGKEVRFEKVKGHSGDTLNELVDGLAKDQVQWARDVMKTKGGLL